MPVTQNRHLSPYELNHLRAHLGYLPEPNLIGESPVEHLTHHAEFMGLDFFVNQSVLIPRIDSEQIVNLSLQHLKNLFSLDQSLNVLDLATGSGCLGISLFHHLQKLGFKNLNFTLSDISPQALLVTKLNLQKLLTKQTNINTIQSDLFQNLPTAQKYHLILSNPPYIPSGRISNLDSSVKDFEPHLALDGGLDGTYLINQILKNISAYLQPLGLSIIEIDHTHTLNNFNIPSDLKPQIILDDQGQNRFLLLQKQD